MNNPFNLFKNPIKIYFIEEENEKQFSEDMWNAYQRCEDAGILPKWIKENDCLNFQFQLESSYIFVLEKFEGKVFEELHQKDECSLFGPKFLLHCFLTRGSIPPRMNLVLNKAMGDIIIYLSNCTPEELVSYKNKIKYMNGLTMDVLHHRVTHFVTNAVIHKKYFEATKKGLKIYTKDWISAVWETNLKLSLSANDEKFDKYKTPIFMNLAITIMNLSTDETSEIRGSIEQHGGEFRDSFTSEKYNILITKDYTITKENLNYAKKRKIPCLSLDWVINSVKTGYALPFNKFLITKSIQHLEKQLDYSQKDSAVQSIPKSPQIIHKNDKENKENIPITTDYYIHVVGFPSIEESRIEKMINEIKGLKRYKIGNKMTHLLVGDVRESMATLNNIQAIGLKPHILGIQWLEMSFKLKKPAPEKSFELNKLLNMAPLSLRVPVSQINNPSQISIPSKLHDPPKKTIPKPSEIDNSTKISSNPSKIIPQIFKNLKFLITGLKKPSPSLSNAITAFGGRLLPQNPKGIPDYAIVPLAGDYSMIKANEIVTRAFIQDCLLHNMKMDIKYYHRPFYVPDKVKPLTDCVIYFETFSSELEINYLLKLVDALGASRGDTLSRGCVDKGKNGIYLVCQALGGDQCNAAIKWKIPIVTGEWLKACADELRVVDEQQYLVGDMMV